MVLSDREIAEELGYGELKVEPVNLSEQLQPCSLDIRLGVEYGRYEPGQKIIPGDASFDAEYETQVVSEGTKIEVHPDDFLLFNTMETMTIPDYLGAEVRGRSSYGRLGIQVHSTAGWIDAGFEDSELVLEVSNVSNNTVVLEVGERIAQLVFYRLGSPAKNPYNSEDNKYQGQKGAVPSRLGEQ